METPTLLGMAFEEIQAIHEKAANLVQAWWPDTKQYPGEKRKAELEIMKMLLDIEALNGS